MPPENTRYSRGGVDSDVSLHGISPRAITRCSLALGRLRWPHPVDAEDWL